MNTNQIILISVILSIIFIAGCQSTSTTSQQSTTKAISATAQPAGNAAVTISGFEFNPGTLTVKTGTSVTWTNQDTAPHTISASSFSSQRLNKGDSYTFKFDKAGTYDYSCGIHPSMKGKVIVE